MAEIDEWWFPSDELPKVNQPFKVDKRRLNLEQKDLLLEALRLHHGKPRFDFASEIIGHIRC